MQQKYNNDDPSSRFEFREEYWEQALALIEADEAQRRKKRRRMLWWGFSALLVLAGIGWWQMGAETSTASTLKGVGDGHSLTSDEATKSNQHYTDVQAGRNTGAEAIDTLQEKISRRTPTVETLDNQTLQKIIQKEQRAASHTQNSIFSRKTVMEKSSNTSQVTVASIPGGAHISGTATDPTPSTVTGKSNNTGQVKVASIPGSTPGSGAATDLASSTPKSPGASIPASNGGTLQPSKGQSNAANSRNTAPVPANSQGQAPPAKIDLQVLSALPFLLNPVHSDSLRNVKQPIKVSAPAAAASIKPVADKRFSMAAAANATAYQKSLNQRWLGFSTSVSGQYRLSQNWSISLGFGARFQPGIWRDSTGYEAGTSELYSFGFEKRAAERNRAGLLSLEIPIAVSHRFDAFSVSLGIAPGKLLYALDHYKETLETSFKARHTVRNRLERGDTSIYGKYYIQTFLSAEYQLLPHVSLTLRGNYRFGALVNATSEDPAIRKGASVALGVKYTFVP